MSKLLTVMLTPDNGEWRKGVWSNTDAPLLAANAAPLERQGGVMSWVAKNDDLVLSKFKENGYTINLMVDTTPRVAYTTFAKD